VEVGPQGLLVVDAGDGRMNDQVASAIRRISNQPVRFFVNTSIDPDHTGGNEGLNKAIGEALMDRQRTAIGATGADIIAQENVCTSTVKRFRSSISQLPIPMATAWCIFAATT
jgi:glyoxylase-like metal-dependent hydrolase (beta-lactamase superfamily II)